MIVVDDDRWVYAVRLLVAGAFGVVAETGNVANIVRNLTD